MSFLQPFLLVALPLVALPIVIHLINQRRYQTIRWAAMMFLLAANRMSRGYARLRQWLILVFRMLAIAALVFTVSRPLASGWLGLTAGGRADTTIILVDRSPSMQQQRSGTVGSKLETGRRQLARTLKMLGSSRWVLIENTTNQPRELDSPDALVNMPTTESSSMTADLPAMLQAAHDYIRDNHTGRTEIWICSDIRRNDWNAESGRWQTLRSAFLEFPQSIRFHLLAYSQAAPGNISVRVASLRRQEISDSVELLISLRLAREGESDTKISVPVQFEIDGARSEVTVEMVGSQYDLIDHRILLARGHDRGWGRVSIPADLNPADNDFYFVFEQSPPRHAIVVSDDVLAVRPLQLAAAIAPDPSLPCSVEVLERGNLPSVEWEKVSLLLWHGRLPRDNEADAVQSFIQRGGQAIFFPPKAPDNNEFFGARWKSWTEAEAAVPIDSWRGDQDLLANTQSGAALPVGQLQIRKYCGLSGDTTPLATLKGGNQLLARVPTPRGGVYFCATTPAVGDSSLAIDGVVLYVLVQRALSAGASALGNTQQLVAGEARATEAQQWRHVAGSNAALSTEFAFHSGVYASDERLWAVNRLPSEDQAPVLSDARVAELFRGLDFARVDDQAGNLRALIQEVWRLFLFSMMVALLVEAGLCLPKVVSPRPQALGQQA